MMHPEGACAADVQSDGSFLQVPETQPPLPDAYCPFCSMPLQTGCATTTAFYPQDGAVRVPRGLHNVDGVQWTAAAAPLEGADTKARLGEFATMLTERLRRPLEVSLAEVVHSLVASEVAGLSAQLEKTRRELVNLIRREREPGKIASASENRTRSHLSLPPAPRSKSHLSLPRNMKSRCLRSLQSDLDDSILSQHSSERINSRGLRRPSEDSGRPSADFGDDGRPSSRFEIEEESRQVDIKIVEHAPPALDCPPWCMGSKPASPHSQTHVHKKVMQVAADDREEQPEALEAGWGQLVTPDRSPVNRGGSSFVLPGSVEDEQPVLFESIVSRGEARFLKQPSMLTEEGDTLERRVSRKQSPSQPLTCLVKQRVSELTDELERQNAEVGATKVTLPVSLLPLWLAGVLPWDMGNKPVACLWRRSLWYQWGCLIVLTTAMLLLLGRILVVWMGVSAWEDIMLSRNTWLLADLPVTCAGPVGMAAVGTHAGSRMLCKCHGLMMPNVEQTGVHPQWKRQSYVDTCLAVTLWVAAVASRWYTSGAFSNKGGVIFACAFAICSGTLMALCLCTFHVCNCLTGLIHVFASNARNGSESLNDQSVPQIASLVKEWNVVQSTIRKSSGAVGHLMACLQVALISTLVLGALDRLNGRAGFQDLAPLAPLLALVATAFMRAAAVTDTCTKVPPFINALVSDGELDYQCQYVVRYIADSAAGFYIFDVQVTAAMVLKLMYFCGAFIFAVATKLTGS